MSHAKGGDKHCKFNMLKGSIYIGSYYREGGNTRFLLIWSHTHLFVIKTNFAYPSRSPI